ncbi:MAG: hypothetical protein M5R36_28060 [Deltaproteobacteria bacterium]|nr:hypothetical protein [Deltaproteobacteria bacterium]
MRAYLIAICTTWALFMALPAFAEQPSPRTGTAMAPLPDGSLLLFGGLDEEGNALGDTWIYSTAKDSNWYTIQPPNPPDPRNGHTMVTLLDGSVMLFGGENIQAELMNDLHRFTNNVWEAETPSGPLPPLRRDHAMWANGSLAYIFGGRGEIGDLNDLWAYDPAAETWEQKASAANPAAGVGVGAAATAVYILGQTETTPMYAYETDEWYDMPFGHDDLIQRKKAANVWSNYEAWIFGGISFFKDGTVLGDAWLFDYESGDFAQLADLPFPVTGAAAAIVGEANAETVFLFGGELADGTLSDTLLSYDTTTDAWDEPDVIDDDDDDDDAGDDDDDGADDDVDDGAADDDDDNDDDDGGCCGC